MQKCGHIPLTTDTEQQLWTLHSNRMRTAHTKCNCLNLCHLLSLYSANGSSLNIMYCAYVHIGEELGVNSPALYSSYVHRCYHIGMNVEEKP